MAEVIEFKKATYGTFFCCCDDDKVCLADHSGRYVRESDYAELLERHRRLVDAVKVFPDVRADIGSPLQLWAERIRAALAEEVDDGHK